MSMSAFARCSFPAAVVVWMAVAGVQAAEPSGTAQTRDVKPVNSGANPYRIIRDWAKITSEKRPWGGSNGVAIDKDGKSVWATDRCSPGTSPGCLGTKANPIHHFDEIREGDQELWRRNVRVAAWHPCRQRRKCVGDRRECAEPRRPQEVSGRRQEGKRCRQVQSRRQGADDAGQARGEGKSAAGSDRADRCPHRSKQWRRLRGRESYQRRGPQSCRAHLGVRQEREVPEGHRQDRIGAGRVPHAARARIRFAGAADRRRPPQPPSPDPDEGREVYR